MYRNFKSLLLNRRMCQLRLRRSKRSNSQSRSGRLQTVKKVPESTPLKDQLDKMLMPPHNPLILDSLKTHVLETKLTRSNSKSIRSKMLMQITKKLLKLKFMIR